VTLLRLPEPYDFALSTGRFRAFGPDLANLWHEGGLHRVVAGREVRIERAPGGVSVESLDAETEPVVRRLLGADFDLAGFQAFAEDGDPVLRRLVAELAGLRPPLAPDPFEALVTSISAQQVSLRAAFAIRNRLISTLGKRADHAYSFPSRAAVAAVGAAELRRLGFSEAKSKAIVGLARSELDLEELRRLPDDEVRARLIALPGIGEWTAEWFLARHLARPQAWPAGDLGVRKAVAAFYDGSVADVRSFGDRFTPFQNLAAHYLLVGLITLS
jgi:3-methyladenine DNA glycosylase/8-oxoguanine DNA glycosylase